MKNQKGISSLIGIIIIVVVAVVAVGGIFTYQYFTMPKENNQQQNLTTCTEEVKVCPDGSAVGRTGPNCEFSDCPAIIDQTAGWKTYSNENAGYTFKYPKEWNAVTNGYNFKNALFGLGATSVNGYGGVEYAGNLSRGQSLEDFVKEFNKGIEEGSISEKVAIISGQSIVISILPKAATEPTEAKSVSFERNGEVFNIYLMYKTNFVQHPEDEQRLNIFNQMLFTFKFIK